MAQPGRGVARLGANGNIERTAEAGKFNRARPSRKEGLSKIKRGHSCSRVSQAGVDVTSVSGDVQKD